MKVEAASAGADHVTLRSMAVASASAAERFGARTAFRFKRDGAWTEQTFAEVAVAVDEIALGLVDLGIGAGDRVCILAETRPEWSLVSLAISAAGAIAVPIYPTSAPSECAWVIGNSGATVVVCEDAGQVAKVEEVREDLPALEHVVVVDGDAEQTLEGLRERGRAGESADLDRRREAVAADDAYTIIYTSGTTGKPKGCVLTHGNALSVCQMVQELDFVGDEESIYLYLPLAHVFALTSQIAAFDVGCAILFFGGDTKQIVAELQELRPTYVPSVPRIFEKIHALATQALEKASEQDRAKFEKAVEVGVEVRARRARGEDVPEDMQAIFDRAEPELYVNVRNLFGGHVSRCVTGAAPIAPEILEFFYACGVPVLEGWGMSETTAVGAVATLAEFRFGTVGRPMPGVEIRTSAQDSAIELRGPNVFREYWDNPDATRETFTDDGWLKTGDVGEIDPDGFVKITGRKKDIIITAGGKNLTLSEMENDLKQSRFISQAVMHGDRRPYPVALVTLDEETIVPWAQEQGLSTDVAELSRDPRVRELIQRDVDRANEQHAQVAQIKRFVILDHDLSLETGELTPTLKVKRNVVEREYAELFDALYSQ